MGAYSRRDGPSVATGPVVAEPPPDLYQQIVESAHEGIWIHDLAGQTTFANAQMADLLGYSLTEMQQLSLFDLLDEVGQTQARQMLERERTTPLTEQVDCRYLHKDGSPVWCLVARSPLHDGAGAHIGSINLVSDITERKRVDESLQRNSELLAEAQRVGHLGSWTWEVSDDVIDWSDEMYHILGLTKTGVPLTFESFLGLVYPEDRETLLTEMSGGIDIEAAFDYECRVVRPSGEIGWIHFQGTTTRDLEGNVRSVRGTVLDVTAYKNAVHEVERTSARYRLLQQMATEANRDTEFEQVLRLAVSEILTHTKWPVGRAHLVSGDPPQLADLEPLGAAASSAAVRETPLPRQVLTSGRSTWLVPLPFDDGSDPATVLPGLLQTGFAFPVLVDDDVVAVLEFLTDQVVARDDELLETCEQVSAQLARVVQRQRAADELAAARDAAMESVRVKSEFLATMSHEIRTPMNGVIGLTHLLLDTELDERQRQYAEGVQVSGEALLTVINDILDFSKLEAGKVVLDCEDFEVRRVVDEVAELLAPTASAKGLELLAYCWPNVPSVLVGDSGRIRQILVNLVSNGVKFSATGEVVTRVTASRLANEIVNLRFEVRDTGIGIPEESRALLFQSFSQADASTTRRYGGTGLGLAISQRLVDAMGGSIGFDSEVDSGSTFWFEIPLRTGQPLPPAVPLRPDVLTGLRVLVVDDNATNRTILESQLGSWDMHPDLVDSAGAALVQLRARAAAGQPYTLAVLDLCMPDMDGLELGHQISADPALSDTRLIMLTSVAPSDPAPLRAAGIREWLTKPVRSSDLFDRLIRVMTPQSTPEPPARSDRHSSSAVTAAKGRVLVVEDNPLNQLVAQGIVTTLGYTTDVVANGAAALHAILETSYSAVLMDCHMPVLDGYETTREIRRRQGGGVRLPIIAMTAGAMAEDRERCAAAGMDDFVSKPVSLASVQAALTQWVTVDADDSVPEVTSTVEGDRDPVWAAEPALDLNRIAQLRQLGSLGGTDLLGRVVGLFGRDGHETLDQIRQAAVSHSVAEGQQALHKLKGTSANMGANRVAALCRQLEEELERDTDALTSERLDQLAVELDHAGRAIAQAV